MVTGVERGIGRFARWALLGGALLTAGCTGGGETVISGLGNSGNHVGRAALWATLGAALARQDVTPVSDEELRQVYAAIQRRALDGELESALVLLKLAEAQRAEEE